MINASPAAVGRRSTQTSLVEELTASKKKLENELATVGRQQKFFKVAVVNRARFLPDLLDVVSEAASEEAVVDRVDETQQQEIHVAGWATSEVAASRFAESLASALRKWHLVLKKPAVKEAKGRLGLDGYSIELYFTTDSKWGRNNEAP